ncbi:hypothetical protein MSAN_00125700 [Mycena sanguinolenta]|uniref:Uncharacterized protein n=1 Tax=Mycena sanguinolenta TaxID=230812 RepID=A0A8H6ZG26_9AGAR|nr:hypothetical protein MSAN_00125700 [Mycena sanguinolenta]
MDKKKQGSKKRKREKRERECANSFLKSVHQKHLDAAKQNSVKVDVDASELPHTKPGWIGKLFAQDGSEAPKLGDSIIQLPSGLESHSYTQEEIDAMSGTKDFSYIAWPGDVTVPLTDSHRRLFALLGGKPKDLKGWKIVTDGAASMMARLGPRGHFTHEDLTHRRAHPDSPYPSISRGPSHGGGQTRPGELCNHPVNVAITDEMIAHEYFRRIVGFTNCLVRVFAPLLFLFYQSQMALLAAWDATLRSPFQNSVFAACTFNFGPRAATCSHLDFGNLAWGWCAITALGSFDADRGGHLILWDLKLIIRFPAGSTILIPSAILRHSNIPVQSHESRFSFVQYTAGGLFRWIRNGYMTEEALENTASVEEKLARASEREARWQDGVNMYSVVNNL